MKLLIEIENNELTVIEVRADNIDEWDRAYRVAERLVDTLRPPEEVHF